MTNVTYLSDHQSVNITDDYFGLVSLDHFWVRRRFEVFKKLLQGRRLRDLSIAEVGCGSGIVQRQIEQYVGAKVDGFDLNSEALRNSIAEGHRLFYYDVNERRSRFYEKYDFIVLFDVIEHISDAKGLLESVRLMTKPGGRMAINVPALQSLYSKYDENAGHIKRYNKEELESLLESAGLDIETLTYWGSTLIPLILVRKLILSLSREYKDVTARGFSPRNQVLNRVLYALSSMEKIPQKLTGTSLMVVAKGSQA